jgi:carbonic anhydrase
VGFLSGSHTSVSGPAAGLTAIVIAQIANLGFDGFLLALVIAGVIQLVMGFAKAGQLSSFFPSSVIKGLLAAIGVILILKQIPHLLGHDKDPEGEMSFLQPDGENTFTELFDTFYEIAALFQSEPHFGSALIGVASIVILVVWGRIPALKNSLVPAPLIVVVLGVFGQLGLSNLGETWAISSDHLVNVPTPDKFSEWFKEFQSPNWSKIFELNIYIGAVTIAIVASLETLLNLEAVDKLDHYKRNSPGSRELCAQGVGNICSGLIGGLPMTSVIVRSSVNVNMRATTKRSAIFHGFLLLIFVGFFPGVLNLIPLAALAGILIVTGFKLASPSLFQKMWHEGRYQFAPFIITLIAIVFTDLLVGILIGLAVSLVFILNSNLRQSLKRTLESHIDGDVLHVQLPNQVSFLNRASITRTFDEMKQGRHLVLDASASDYIDPDILSLIREFKEVEGPVRGVQVSLKGFKDKYNLSNEIQYADYSTRELQSKITPEQVLALLKSGNQRFRDGHQLARDFSRQVASTASGQNPLAAVLSCIDSRVPTELVFDLGIGDIFSVRVAGNIVGSKSLGSLEYGVAVAGSKLLLVMGHTRCGAVTASIQLVSEQKDVLEATGCPHLPSIVSEVNSSFNAHDCQHFSQLADESREEFIDDIAKRNVMHTVHQILERSEPIRKLHEEGKVMVLGAMYDVKSGIVEFLETPTH